jgi:hypothetical protein
MPRTTDRCAGCGERLAPTRTAMLLGTDLLCLTCTEQQPMHGRYYPACEVQWHDLYDHQAPLGEVRAVRMMAGD